MKNRLFSLFSFLFSLLVIIPTQVNAELSTEISCAKLGGYYLPVQFINDIEEDRFYDPVLQEHIENYNKVMQGIWHQNTDRILSYPDLQERIEQWHIEHGMSQNFEEECPQQLNSMDPEDMSIIPENDFDTEFQGKRSTIQQNAQGQSTRKPKHSVAKTIFRKRKVKIQIFDTGLIPDGDRVQVHVNGFPIYASLFLKSYPGTTIDVYLRPSSKLQPVGANRINIYPLSQGISPRLSIGLAIDDPDIVFEGSEIPARRRGELKGVLEIDASVVQQIPAILFGVGLVCISPANSESILHIQEAVAPDPGGNPAQKLGRPRILTVHRPLKDSRRDSSIKLYKDKGLTLAIPGVEDLDEYPPAVFIENFGKGHVKPIDKFDNRRAGNDIKRYITGPGSTTVENAVHKDFDQVEIVTPDSGLFCKDAF